MASPRDNQVNDQLMGFILQQLPYMSIVVQHSGHFRLEPKNKKSDAILEVTGTLKEAEENVICLEFEVLRTSESVRINVSRLFGLMAALSEKAYPVGPVDTGNGIISLRVALKVQATLMSMTRATLFLAEIEKINNLANLLQQEIPCKHEYHDLLALYKPLRDTLDCVVPYTGSAKYPAVNSLMHEILETYQCGLCQALISKSVLQEKLLLARLSDYCLKQGTSLGYVMLPAVSWQTLPDLLFNKAPGIVALSASALTMGTGPFDRIEILLKLLTFSKSPPLFVGDRNQLQTLFAMQSGKFDPLLPVVRYLPEQPLEELVRFGVENEAARNGGLSAPVVEECINSLMLVFTLDSNPEYEKTLFPIITSMVKTALKSSPPKPNNILSLRDRLLNYKHSLNTGHY